MPKMFDGPSNQSKAGAIKNYQTQLQLPQPDSQEWNLNPTLYQNLSNDQVDWGALAQQWIQMKETFPPGIIPMAPPPPTISLKGLEEKGEAPMEVEKDDDHQGNSFNRSSNSPTECWSNNGWNSYPPHSQWRNPAWETWNDNNVSNQTKPDNNSSIELMNDFISSSSSGNNNNNRSSGTNVWPTKIYRIEAAAEKVQHKIPSLMDEEIMMDNSDEDTTQTIDVAKRKLLPAWIREGLEKMEREKLKVVEKERENKEKEKMLQLRRIAEREALQELEGSGSRLPKRSKFDSDSDSDDPDVLKNKTVQFVPKRTPSPEILKPHRTREEQIQEIMMSVRKNLTEILLEVTNEEIANIAKETLSKTRRKAPSAQNLRKTALTSLTGGLGLGIYADSSEDESDTDKEVEESNKREEEDVDSDSDGELILQETIRRRKAEFEKTAREIEIQIEEEEAREERKKRERELQQHQVKYKESSDEENGTSSRSNRDGETQPLNDKFNTNPKSGRRKDKKMSRFSDPNDTVRNTHITHVAILSKNAGEPIPIVPIHKIEHNATGGYREGSESSDNHSSSSYRRKRQRSQKRSHRSRRRDIDDEYADDDSTYRRSRSTESSSSRRRGSRSHSRSSKSHRYRSRSKDRKHSSSSSVDYRKHRSSSRSHDHHRRRSRSRSSRHRY